MSMEDIVKEKHEFEDRVNRFLTQIDKCTSRAMTMTTRELEICMARLYDLMIQASDETLRLDLLFKGLLVKCVYDKRKAGEKQKYHFWTDSSWPNEIVKWRFQYPVPITEALANEWGQGGSSAVRKLLTD